MTKWEYKIHRIELWPRDNHAEVLTAALNKLGTEGWEVFESHEGYSKDHYVYTVLMKRPHAHAPSTNAPA